MLHKTTKAVNTLQSFCGLVFIAQSSKPGYHRPHRNHESSNIVSNRLANAIQADVAQKVTSHVVALFFDGSQKFRHEIIK